MMLTVSLFLILLTVGETNCRKAWDNDWGQYLYRRCPRGQAISRISSTHSDRWEDRRWNVTCKSAVKPNSCSWSGFVNSFDGTSNFKCSENHVITAIYSYYSTRHEDRRWQFYCCESSRLTTSECQETPWVNYWDENFYWNVPGGNYITGVISYHNNAKGDRRYRFRYCRGTTRGVGSRSSRRSPVDIYSQISEINRNTKGLLEGDIMVKLSRNAMTCKQCKWPKTSGVVEVPYTLDSAYNSVQRKKIANAMNSFHSTTCVRFVPHSNQSSYLSIVKATGCWSQLGRTGGKQYLSLKHTCFHSIGIIQHELIHALGFYHEQSRSDRDRYVRINWENVRPNSKRNFKKEHTNNQKTAYDYASVMHYNTKSFTKNGKDTITPIPDSSVEIGQRREMSKTDILKINRLYECQTQLNTSRWDNDWGRVLSRKCPNGQAFSGVESMHSDEKQDRRWRTSCKTFDSSSTCYWSGFVNKYDGNFNFQCRSGHVIAGVNSHQGNQHGDRRWRFYCCRAPGFTTFDCKSTFSVNYWGERFNWPVPGGNFLTGAYSFHSQRNKDRRWGFRYCQGRSP